MAVIVVFRSDGRTDDPPGFTCFSMLTFLNFLSSYITLAGAGLIDMNSIITCSLKAACVFT